MSLAPVMVDNVELTERTDFADLARRALLGSVGGSLRSDCFPVDWVFRVHRELAGSPYAELLARGVAACLTAPEPDVRAQALIFFESEPRAAGGERLAELAAGDRALFVGVPDPISPGSDLERRLLWVLQVRGGRESA